MLNCFLVERYFELCCHTLLVFIPEFGPLLSIIPMPKFSAKYVSQLTVEKVVIISNTVILQIQGSIQWGLLNFVSVIKPPGFYD